MANFDGRRLLPHYTNADVRHTKPKSVWSGGDDLIELQRPSQQTSTARQRAIQMRKPDQSTLHGLQSTRCGASVLHKVSVAPQQALANCMCHEPDTHKADNNLAHGLHDARPAMCTKTAWHFLHQRPTVEPPCCTRSADHILPRLPVPQRETTLRKFCLRPSIRRPTHGQGRLALARRSAKHVLVKRRNLVFATKEEPFGQESERHGERAPQKRRPRTCATDQTLTKQVMFLRATC